MLPKHNPQESVTSESKNKDNNTVFKMPYAISSFSIYRKSDAIAIAGNTNPTNGTKIDGRKETAIIVLFY